MNTSVLGVERGLNEHHIVSADVATDPVIVHYKLAASCHFEGL